MTLSGARLVSIEFDGQRVFEGEIRKAPGVTGSVEECSEVILFTTDVSVLRAIESQDRVVSSPGDALMCEHCRAPPPPPPCHSHLPASPCVPTNVWVPSLSTPILPSFPSCVCLPRLGGGQVVEAGVDITSQLVKQVMNTLEVARPRTAGALGLCHCASVTPWGMSLGQCHSLGLCHCASVTPWGCVIVPVSLLGVVSLCQRHSLGL